MKQIPEIVLGRTVTVTLTLTTDQTCEMRQFLDLCHAIRTEEQWTGVGLRVLHELVDAITAVENASEGRE